MSIFKEIIMFVNLICWIASPNGQAQWYIWLAGPRAPLFLLPITTPEVVTKPLLYTKDQCFLDVNQDKCAHLLWIWEMCSRRDTTWHLPIMANQLTRLFVLVCHGLLVIHIIMSSLYIDRAVFPTHMYCTTANNFADMQSFEDAMVWGAVTFVKYVDKYVKN